MTVCEADISTPGIIKFSLPDKHTVSLSYDKTLLSAAKEKMELTTPEDKGLLKSWNGRNIYRIVLKAKALNTKGSIKYNIRL